MTKVSKGDGTANSVGIVALPQDFIEETREVKDLMFSAIGEVPVDVEHLGGLVRLTLYQVKSCLSVRRCP